MREHRILILASNAVALCSFAVASTINAIVRAVDYMLAALGPPERALDLGLFPRVTLAGGGSAGIEPALSHSLRHEAHVSHRSAARNV